jgi:hypothetical protein
MHAQIRYLRTVCLRCLGDSDPQIRWLGGALDNFLSQRCRSVDEALGLRFPRGGMPWWREEATRTRDAALRRLAALRCPSLAVTAQAREVHALSIRYAASAWRFDREREAMPAHYAGTAHEFPVAGLRIRCVHAHRPAAAAAYPAASDTDRFAGERVCYKGRMCHRRSTVTSMATRRQFLGAAGAAAAGAALEALLPAPATAATGWNAGRLAHVIPTASHDRFLIKTSFVEPLAGQPRLLVGDRSTPGIRGDSRGRFWRFDVAGLAPATAYTLQIADAGGRALCDPWPLKTFPAPDAPADRLRILAFTCSGGYDRVALGDQTIFLDNGDMIYWDIATALNKGEALAKAVRAAWTKVGMLDFGRPMLGAENEAVLQRIADYQIAGLYGTGLRSIPSFFLTDDHDLFENDEGTAELVTLPPTPARIAAARTVQRMYYPEFLRGAEVAESFGALRHGRLVEAVLYDAKRYVSLGGDDAGMVPTSTEAWLLERTARAATAHLIHVPSTPFGWSAGKLGEWYPDVARTDGTLGTGAAKPHWPSGWWRQHQRLVAALAAQRNRVPLVLQGDLHAAGYGIMRRSGSLDLANPVHLALTGPLGTGDIGFPSAYRGTKAQPSSRVALDELMPPVEKNGFTIVDVGEAAITLRVFTWRPPEPLAKIDSLAPSFVHELARR